MYVVGGLGCGWFFKGFIILYGSFGCFCGGFIEKRERKRLVCSFDNNMILGVNFG